MENKIKNFGRFYVLARKNPEMDKESLVHQFTGGRTVHLREMRAEEYNRMCDALEYGHERSDRNAAYERLRHLRSSVLVRLGRLGISTVDNWDGIDRFCMSEKIAGKKFKELSADELSVLIRKLENIMRKGGLQSLESCSGKQSTTAVIPLPYLPSKHVS